MWALGFVSLLMDVSSEMIHSLLPVFMVSALGASVLMVGVIEGIAEATALIAKVFSGTLSDYLGRRKLLAVTGYGLGAFSKPLFALAATIDSVLAARFIDRVGKGIRGAPRDALIADLTPPEIRGAAYGLRQSLDSVGAFLGPVLAILLMILWAGDFRAVFWFAVIPGFLCLALLIAGVQEPAGLAAQRNASPIHWRTLAQLRADYWSIVAIGGVFTLARFSEAFLILRARDFGLPDEYAPAVLILMNVTYALTAYPAGKLADRMSHRTLLIAGLAVLIAADLALAHGGRTRHRCPGRHVVGIAHGAHSGVACNHGRADGARRSARYRFWLLQPRERAGDAWRQRACRAALEYARSAGHLLCGSTRVGNCVILAGGAPPGLTGVGAASAKGSEI